jgi:hypothetical protein
MKKSKLMKELRGNLADSLKIALEEITELTDKEVLDLFTTCHCCGEPMLGRKQRRAAIKQANSGLEFLKLCGWCACDDEEDEDGGPRITHGHPRLN